VSNINRIYIANLTPFRGPSADPGTVFEDGLAETGGELVVARSDESEGFFEKELFDRCVKLMADRNFR